MLFFSDLTYCFDNLIVDSHGAAKESYPSAMGRYLRYQELNGKPIFKHVRNEIYLYWYSDETGNDKYWTVSKIIQVIINNYSVV